MCLDENILGPFIEIKDTGAAQPVFLGTRQAVCPEML